LASPFFSLLTAHNSDHPFSWITADETYQTWLNWPDPQLLYIYGKGAQEASEYIFYSLDEPRQASEKNEVVVLFTFDAYDFRYQSINDMLSTFLAQIINHHPSLAEFVLLQFNNLRLDRSMNKVDLLSWFEYFRIRGQIDGVTCVINHFDDCDEASRKRFLDRFTYISERQERPWKIVVTSREPGALLDELSGCQTLDLDGLLVDAAATMHPDSLRLLQLTPRIGSETDSIDKKMAKLDGADPVVRQVILQQARVRDEWSAYTTSLQFQLGSAEDPTLNSILELILEGVPDPPLARRILIWAVHSVLPLTIWELGTAIFVSFSKGRGTEHTASGDFVADIVDKIRTWFAGILKIKDNEVMVVNVQIRRALMEMLKDEVPGVHQTIVETCLQYLQRDSVKAIIETRYIQPFVPKDVDPSSMDAPTFPDRTSLYSYAIRHWPEHFVLIPPSLRPRDLLRQFVESNSVYCWSQGHWVLAHPILRSTRFQTVYPLFTVFGLGEDAEPWRNGDTDLSLALAEAAMNGFPAEVRKLLSQTRHSEAALQETLVTAGSNGDEDTLMYLIRHIEKNYEDFNWPASLLYRAAWLGMDQVVSALLDLGIPVRPNDPTRQSTPLHIASRNGHVEVLKVLLKGGADVNYRGPYGQSALHLACANGHAEATDILAEEAGVDLDARDEDNFTPLYEACLWGNFMSVKVLVAHGADTSLGTSIEQDSSGWTPLIVSSEEGYLRCLQILLEAGADPNLPGPHGTPLHYAVSEGHIDLCELLLEHGADPNHPTLDPPILTQIFSNVTDADLRFKLLKLLHQNGARVDEIDASGMSALLHAALLGDVPCVEYLLDHGADAKLADAKGRTAFDSAVKQAFVEVVRLLLDKGGDVTTTAHQEQSPLFNTVKKPEMVRLLLDREFDPDARSPEGFTPLMLAAGDNHVATVKVLLDREATIDLELWHSNGGAKSGWTALAFAAERGNSEIVLLLAEAGANVNHRVDDGSTVLHLATGSDAMRTLMEFRPDVSVPDNDQNTPLHRIRTGTPLDHVQLLVRAGASLDVQNKDGYTPLSIALLYSNDAAASYLIERQANVNLASHLYGAPLHLACRDSTVTMVRQLVQAGADVDLALPGTLGTPLQAAVLRRGYFEEGSQALIQYLIDEAGAAVNRKGGTYGTVLAAATLQASPTLVSFLLEKNALPGLADGMGRVPLHLATLRGLEHFKLLHSAGADLSARDKTGRSVLHWAAQGGSAELVEYILSLLSEAEDFDIDERDNDGWTALCWASRGCGSEFRNAPPEAQFEVVKLLLERDADPGLHARFSNREYWTPPKIARYSCAPEEVVALLDEAAKGRDKHAADEERQKVVTSATKAFLHIGSYCAFCLAVCIPLFVIGELGMKAD
jgi:ankyrin repeat protein